MRNLLLLFFLVCFGPLIALAAELEPKTPGDPAALRPLPAKEPSEALRSLEVIDGFQVEFVAHEPMVLDPVAAIIDESGTMYVAELADYPYRPEPGRRPLGRIRLLRDQDGDGFYEDSHVFAEGLLWAAGLAPWKGGVFVTAPPDIWYLKDTNGDLRADITEKVYTGFGTDGSQYILNNLQWGPDHKIYASVAGNGGEVTRADQTNEPALSLRRRDFCFSPATREFEAISGGRQFGNTFDDWGNRFLCTQDTPVYHVLFPQRYLSRNPFLPQVDATHELVADGVPIFRTSPVEAWREIRSSRRLLAERGTPDQSGVSHHVLDGLAGVTVYRGGAFPSSFYGNVFCGDAQNNLVHRRSLVHDGVTFRSERLDAGTEFLRSNDNWFRPVNFVNAPDGTLYVLDLAREILEAVHIPMDVVAHLDLTRGRDRGRIYRVKPAGFQAYACPRLGEYKTEALVGCLNHSNSWWRETAHRLLYERQDKSVEPALRALLKPTTAPSARLLAFWSLHGLDLLNDQDVLAALADAAPEIREQAVGWAESRFVQSPRLVEACAKLAQDPDVRVRFQLAFTLGESSDPRTVQALAVLARRDVADKFVQAACLSSSHQSASDLIQSLLADPSFEFSSAGLELLRQLALTVGGNNRRSNVLNTLATGLRHDRLEVQQALVLGLAEGLHRIGQTVGVYPDGLNLQLEQRWQRLMESAILTVQNVDADPAHLTSALRLLEESAPSQALDPVLSLLNRFPPESIQVVALHTISSWAGPEIPDRLLSRWKTAAPAARREILSALLAKSDRAAALLEGIEQDRLLAGEVDASSRTKLLNYPDAAIRSRAAALWSNNSNGRGEIIKRYRAALALDGSAEAGRKTFERLCGPCHRLNGQGREVGPNLALSATRTKEDLLVNILDPNREVDPAFVQYTLITKQDEIITGLLAGETPVGATLKNLEGERVVPRSQIKELSSGGLSLMPIGLEQGLELQDMADLLAYIIASQYDYGTSGRSGSRDVPERPAKKRER